MVRLSIAQARHLLRFNAVGDFGRPSWSTIESLSEKGLLNIGKKQITVTSAGRAWCDSNHMNYIF